MIYFTILVLMTFVASFASVFLKKAAACNSILGVLKDKNIYLGGILYGSAALLNVYVLKYLDYSVVMPMGAITYIWTMILSYLFFKEKINKKKIIGVILVFVGAICIVL